MGGILGDCLGSGTGQGALPLSVGSFSNNLTPIFYGCLWTIHLNWIYLIEKQTHFI